MPERFEIGEHIGSGGFGTVDAATRVDRGEGEFEPALVRKALLHEHLGNEEAVDRFKREVRILDELDHPNILPILGRDLSAQPPWFVMPRADASLLEAIRGGKAGDREWVVRVFAGVLSGMSYAHSRCEVLHRDLKPENIMMMQGKPMISDFGLGKRIESDTAQLTQTAMMIGTLSYMAPEQADDAARVGPPADVYSLGKILGEMLTGKRPMFGRPKLSDYPDEFRSFIDRCTLDDPNDRYASASDALAAFELSISGAGDTGLVGEHAFEDLIQTWERTPEGQDLELVAKISNALVARKSDEELYFKAVPRLHRLLMRQLIEQRPTDFGVILQAYDAHITGSLPFEYCDVVANFYRDVFRVVADDGHKRLLLNRLIELGPSHNRWRVGQVTSSILAELNGADVGLAADVLATHENRPYVKWLKGYVDLDGVGPPIRKALLLDHAPQSLAHQAN